MPVVIRDGGHADGQELDTELSSGSLGGLQDGSVGGRSAVPEYAEPGRLWHGLLQDLKPLGSDIGLHDGQTRHVSAGACETARSPDWRDSRGGLPERPWEPPL